MMQVTTFAAVVALLICVSGVRAQCDLFDNCASCSPTSGCGWCGVEQRCVSGDEAGPTSKNASPLCQDSWFYNACPDCQGYNSDCLECRNVAACGFCTTGNGNTLCAEGNATGPFSFAARTSCIPSTWSYGVEAPCPSPAPLTPTPESVCAGYSGEGNCGSCVDASGCGWCASTQRCMAGSYSGPVDGTCAAWFTVCPACDEENNCESCVMTLGCGWCQSTEITPACYSGDANSPYRGRCDAWYFNQTVCPTAAPPSVAPSYYCSESLTCYQCNEVYGCGWCAATRTCQSGFTSGSAPPSCPWGWTECADCNSYDTCGACRLSSLCGWCGALGTCLPGNSSGPSETTCTSGWTHYPQTCPTCHVQSTCQNCTAVSGACVWCTQENRCMGGNANGPYNPTACGTQWVYYNEYCPTP